jgi:hypothetical protein
MIEREKNEKWIISHYKELKKKYSDKWVAVKDQQPIASGTSYKKLVAKLKNIYTKQFCEVAVEYIASKDVPIIPIWR